MTYATNRERALEEVYAQIPKIPDCNGYCAESCGPIAMFKGEYERITRSHGREPRARPGSITCPLLSPTGRCTVYTVRPFICRLWGTTRSLACPRGCIPERWLSTQEAQVLFEQVRALTGPDIASPYGDKIEDLWEGIGLDAREHRANLIKAAREHNALMEETRRRTGTADEHSET